MNDNFQTSFLRYFTLLIYYYISVSLCQVLPERFEVWHPALPEIKSASANIRGNYDNFLKYISLIKRQGK